MAILGAIVEAFREWRRLHNRHGDPVHAAWLVLGPAWAAVRVVAFVFLIAVYFAAYDRDRRMKSAVASAKSNAVGVDQRYDGLEMQVRACDERRAAINRLGELRGFFALKLSFAAFGSAFPDSPFDTIEKHWQGHTGTIAEAFKLFRSDSRLFSEYEVSQMQLPASRFYTRSPYKHPTPEHARMWQESYARMNLIDEIVARLQASGCELPVR
jgi:hypothetical protein